MGLAGGPVGAVVINLRLRKTNPRYQPAQKAVRLAQPGQFCQCTPAQQPEVARVARDGDAAQLFDQEIKQPGRDPLAEIFPPPVLAGGIHHVVTLVVRLQQLQNYGGRILQVGVHGRHNVPARGFEAGSEGDLMAEVAREVHPDPAGQAITLRHDEFPAPVLAAIIDQHDFDRAMGFEKGLACLFQRLKQRGQDLLLVVNRDNDGKGILLACHWIRIGLSPFPMQQEPGNRHWTETLRNENETLHSGVTL